MMADGTFREQVIGAGESAVKIVADSLKGAPISADRVRLATATMNAALKVEHMNQLRDQTSVSNGLRLVGMLRDPSARQEYFETMRTKIMPKAPPKALGQKKE